ncbi:MAG: hypothetical protein ABWY57_16335 [Mycetocola sp.]
MSNQLDPRGFIAMEGGDKAPYFIIPFDERGSCVGPRAQEELIRQSADATDVYLFSHGWNNDWSGATSLYRRFVDEFLKVRNEYWPEPDRPYEPILAGAFWPSILLVDESEAAPTIAGANDGGDGTFSEFIPELLALSATLPVDDRERFYELLSKPYLDREEALEIATIAYPHLDAVDTDLSESSNGPEQLAESWMEDEGVERTTRVGGYVGDSAPEMKPQAAGGGFLANLDVRGLLSKVRPRTIIRSLSVLTMKDRAGTVGANGVASLLARLAAESDNKARIHLVGHSYGCKVALSALCAPDDQHAVEVDSVLLLQPAVSCYCFAGKNGIPGVPHPGGYHKALERSRLPVVCTFSNKDIPLSSLFHLAARRQSDLGEVKIAGAPPNRYAALGGYGPQGVAASDVIDARPAPRRYEDFSRTDVKVLGVKSHDLIRGHGDVSSSVTAWMLLEQVRR